MGLSSSANLHVLAGKYAWRLFGSNLSPLISLPMQHEGLKMHDYLWKFPAVRVGKPDRQSDAPGTVLYFLA